MKEFIKWLIDEKAKFFVGGFLSGFAPAIIFLFDLSGVPATFLTWALKFTGAVFIAFGTGIAAALATDAYKWIKGRFKKKEVKDEEKKAA